MMLCSLPHGGNRGARPEQPPLSRHSSLPSLPSSAPENPSTLGPTWARRPGSFLGRQTPGRTAASQRGS